MYCSWQKYLPCAALDNELLKPYNLLYIYIFILFITYFFLIGWVYFFRILQGFSTNMAGWCSRYSLYSRGGQTAKTLEQHFNRHFRRQHRVYSLLNQNVFVYWIASHFCSSSHRRFISVSYESPLLRHSFRTPCRSALCASELQNYCLLATTCPSIICDISESHATSKCAVATPAICHPLI